MTLALASWPSVRSASRAGSEMEPNEMIQTCLRWTDICDDLEELHASVPPDCRVESGR